MDKQSRFGTMIRFFLDLRFVLAFIAIAYIAAYFAFPATPGNSPDTYPLGWWGWFDQGKYLLSANALIKLDFAPHKHFYPPLYPAIGAIFLKWSTGHMFFAVNLLSLLWLAFTFIRFSDRYIPRYGGVFLFLATIVFNPSIFENFVIPWTSTLSSALIASGILGSVWMHGVNSGARVKLSAVRVFFVATCLGLLVPTRPLDAVVGGVIGLSLVVSYWTIRRDTRENVARGGYYLLVTIAGSIIGPLLLLCFNIFVFGSPFGGYLQAASANGFFPADLAEKFVSIWLDGFTLYGESNAGLTERFPYLFLSLAGLVWVLVRGDGPLRSAAFAIVSSYILYLPYGDLLPNGLWRYKGIHYFKWTFPFLALFGVLLLKQAYSSWRERNKMVMPLSLIVGIPLLLLSLHLVVDATPVSASSATNSAVILITLPNKELDLIDFKGLSGGFLDVYFGSHRLLLDGRELKRVRDYRLLPMSWGVRLLFIRPVVGHSLEFLPDQKLTRYPGALSAQLGSYRFCLGALKPFRQPAQHEIVADYVVGEVIDFSQRGVGTLYATRGWSVPEAWGRWSVNRGATIQMRLADPRSHALDLELVMGALVSGSHPCQQVVILVNEKEVARERLCMGKGAEQAISYKFTLARELMRADGIIEIRFLTPDSISPKMLGLNSDDRVLGIGLRTLRLVPHPISSTVF
jgi:hypothetical protein